MSSDMYLQIGGEHPVVLVVSYSDRTGITGTFGPFPDEAAANIAKDALLEAGVEMGTCDIMPLRKVVTQP